MPSPTRPTADDDAPIKNLWYFNRKATIIALYNYKGTTDDELNFKKGDTFWVLNDENPDWCPKTLGYVPTTYIQLSSSSPTASTPSNPRISNSKSERRSSLKRRVVHQDERSHSGSQSDVEEEEEEEESASGSESGSYSGNEESDSRSGSESDTEDESESEEEERGRLGRRRSFLGLGREKDMGKKAGGKAKPTPLQIPSQQSPQKSDRFTFTRRTRGHALAPPNDLSPTRRHQHAEGVAGLPPGIRSSTLARTRSEGIGATANYLIPDLHPSNLAFTDLNYDYRKQQLRPLPAHLTLAFSLLSAHNIPTPPPQSQIKILGRHVRMALFDKMHVLSNIHSVQGFWIEGGGWRFSRKASILFPKDDENTCFLRTNDVDIRLSVLFEVCVVVRFEDEGGSEPAELSCGWGLLPLFTADGGPIENKRYEIKLYGGTPFEKGVALGELSGARKGFLQSLINPPRPPRLNIRVWKLGKSALKELNLLPTPLIHLLSLLPLLTIHRKLLAHTLLHPSIPSAHHDHPTPTFPTSYLSAPFLTHLLTLIDTPDLSSILAEVYDRVLRSMRKRDKRDMKIMMKKVEECVRVVGGLEGVVGMGSWRGGDEERAREREVLIVGWQGVGFLESCTRNPNRWGFRPLDVEVECGFDLLEWVQRREAVVG
ncbi:hypothetical protein HK097_006725 [Rhizophlyctis rosea]|uniref:SH3 domain-containing protein n=1 Tax=Rhizophlyctis rosea TaxID=64517 RepID=A0AAD5SCI2_9FUNG|nr:hypothetical protein HK097_006725 [Rhizophlyctis rosea]